MNKGSLKQDWIPEIVYEESRDGGASTFPFIEVPKDKKMPAMLFVFEYKHTGEFEPGPKGEEVPVIDQIPHKYIDLELLKERLDPETNDVVRVALGMEPLKIAQKLGAPKLDKIAKSVEKIKQDLLAKREQEKGNK